MSQYARGRRLEHATIHALADDGYTCMRSAGSKGALDVLAMKPGQRLAVQCKLNGRIPPAERVALLRWADLLQGVPIVAYKKPGSARILYRELVGPGPKDHRPFYTDGIVKDQ